MHDRRAKGVKPRARRLRQAEREPVFAAPAGKRDRGNSDHFAGMLERWSARRRREDQRFPPAPFDMRDKPVQRPRRAVDDIIVIAGKERDAKRGRRLCLEVRKGFEGGLAAHDRRRHKARL